MTSKHCDYCGIECVPVNKQVEFPRVRMCPECSIVYCRVQMDGASTTVMLPKEDYDEWTSIPVYSMGALVDRSSDCYDKWTTVHSMGALIDHSSDSCSICESRKLEDEEE